MVSYVVLEISDGLTVVAKPAGMTAEEVAAKQGGVVVDPGPFKEFEDAYDALLLNARQARETRGGITR